MKAFCKAFAELVLIISALLALMLAIVAANLWLAYVIMTYVGAKATVVIACACLALIAMMTATEGK